MPQYKIRDIAKIINGRLHGNGEEIITSLLTDSRNQPVTENCVFFAIKGKNHDGHDYIEELYQKKVFGFVVNHLPGDFKDYPKATFILVEDTVEALQRLAACHRNNYKNPVVAITGSNGKTIVKEWLFQALTPGKYIIRSPKSYNSQIGVPLSVWLLDHSADMAVIEAGISKKGEMERLQEIIRPDIGLITNIAEAHQENFSSYEEKAEEKLKLFHDAQTLIYCKDHKIIENNIKACKQLSDKKCFTWSQQAPADLTIKNIQKNENHTIISGVHDNKDKSITIPFNDWAAIENGIHVWAFLLFSGYDDELIAARMAALSPVAMRLEMKDGINGCTLINDSYNSDMTSLEIALDFLSLQNQHTKKTVILSDIYQSGKSKSLLYQKIGEVIQAKKINRLIGIGEAIYQHQHLFNIQASFFFKDTASFIERTNVMSFSNEAILLKGSRDFHFENIVRMLEKKNHRTALEINLNALTHNLNYFRSLLKPSTKVMAMVKASSYGSGASEVANLLQYHRVDYLGVAFVDEGIVLREAGNRLPIMIMNPEEGSYDRLIAYSLEPEIYNFNGLQSFSDMAGKHGVFAYPVHIKLDTGMHRLGFDHEDIPALKSFFKQNKQLKIKSVFSHLAASDEKKHDAFTKMQITRFGEMSKELSMAGHQFSRHILNSGGIERFPEAQYDMVRLGIGLYGISVVNQDKLMQISKLKSHIIQIKNIVAGETVGYDRKGILNKDSKIAVIPVGYADGLNRRLGNRKGKMMVNGTFVPFAGNICMDMCMADVTDLEVSVGDEVVIFGEDYTISDMAKSLGTIPYEILTGISERVKRVYYQE